MLNSKILYLYIVLGIITSLLFTTPSYSLEKRINEIPIKTPFALSKKGESHLDIRKLSESIETLNKGEKDVVFISTKLTDTEKSFFKELKMRFPNKNNSHKRSFGNVINLSGNMDKDNIDQFSQKARKDLEVFFDKYTNATSVGKKFGFNGPRLLSNIILEYSNKLLIEFNAQNLNNGSNGVYIMLKALKSNDAFTHYKRWHYDGNGSVKSDENANLNIAGVFVGLPTIFCTLDDKARNTYNEMINDKYVTPSLEDLIKLLKQDQKKYSPNSKGYNLIQNEINNVYAINSYNQPNKDEVLSKLYRRIKIHNLIDETKIMQPTKNQIALFTKEGRNPSFHSEPDMELARLFFAIGVDKANFFPDKAYKATNTEAPEPASLKQKYLYK